jgi:hypothetical protein
MVPAPADALWCVNVKPELITSLAGLKEAVGPVIFVLIITVSPVAGTPDGLQLEAVFQAVPIDVFTTAFAEKAKNWKSNIAARKAGSFFGKCKG